MMNRKQVNYWVKVCLWGAVITGILLLANAAHGEKTKGEKTCWLPEGCVVQYQDNPFTYKPGTVAVSGLVDDAVVIRIQPLGTYELFTEDILFCDRAKVEQKFENKHNPVVLTYKTAASRIVQSVGCHELIRVDELAR